MFSLLRSHLDFPEYVLMAVFYRFIHNLEVAIKDKKSYFSNLGKIFFGGGGESFKSKVKSGGMPSRLSEYIPEQVVLKELLWNFHKIKVCGGVCILKVSRMHSFTGSFKNSSFTFSKNFSNQTKVVNENTEALVELYASCKFNTETLKSSSTSCYR